MLVEEAVSNVLDLAHQTFRVYGEGGCDGVAGCACRAESCIAAMASTRHAVTMTIMPDIPSTRNPKNSTHRDLNAAVAEDSRLPNVDTSEKLKYMRPIEKSIALEERRTPPMAFFILSSAVKNAKTMAATVAKRNVTVSRVDCAKSGPGTAGSHDDEAVSKMPE